MGKKDWKKLRDEMHRRGWRRERCGRHIKMAHERYGHVFLPKTASDWRAYKNMIAELRNKTKEEW